MLLSSLKLSARAVARQRLAWMSVATCVNLPPGLVNDTPLLESLPLSKLAGTRVLLKMDALQPSGSFKDRGMAHMCATLQQRGRTRRFSRSAHVCYRASGLPV